jgi:hypothetical protein
MTAYLSKLFGKTGTKNHTAKALDKLQKMVEAFEIEMSAPGQFNTVNLTWVINGLLSAGLLSEDKNAVLKDFLSSAVILTEVADVLNMRISSITTWSWETDVPVKQRRHVTGAFHMYIDEDLLRRYSSSILASGGPSFSRRLSLHSQNPGKHGNRYESLFRE